jgi:hypothetical protein
LHKNNHELSDALARAPGGIEVAMPEVAAGTAEGEAAADVLSDVAL